MLNIGKICSLGLGWYYLEFLKSIVSLLFFSMNGFGSFKYINWSFLGFSMTIFKRLGHLLGQSKTVSYERVLFMESFLK
jgi:hypothetical protein